MKKEWKKDYQRRYYLEHREEIKSKQRAKYAAKKAVKDSLNVWPLPTTGISPIPKIQDVYIHDFFSKQLERIINVLWWICFAISFVGVAILFK